MPLPSTIEALLLKKSRSIEAHGGNGGIIPDVTISEMHADRVTVTQHPVDAGANIADHAIVEPPVLHCVFGWSDSSAVLNAAFSGSILKGIETTADIYNWLLAAMQQRILFDLSTGKRKYADMLITDLKTTSTAETENVLIIEVSFQKVFLVSTQSTTLSAARQREPERTAPVLNRGRVNAVPWSTDSRRIGSGVLLP